LVNTNNTIEEEIKERISARNKAYFAHKMLFMSKTLSKKSKLILYNSVIRSIVTYASETWVLNKQIEEMLQFLKEKYLKDLWAYC
jgi:dephospho-CoA kinase